MMMMMKISWKTCFKNVIIIEIFVMKECKKICILFEDNAAYLAPPHTKSISDYLINSMLLGVQSSTKNPNKIPNITLSQWATSLY